MQAVLFSSHADEAAVLTVLLQQVGFVVRSRKDLEGAIQEWPERPSDLILISVPDNIEKVKAMVRQFRMHTAVPIILISDLIPEDLQVQFFEEGADLVIIRPFGVRLFLAQVKALLRRSAGVPFFSLPTLSQSDVLLDPSAHTVQVGEGVSRRLTQLEFRLLYTLMTHAGQIIPTEKIVEHVWGYSGDGNRELVRGLIQRLRSKVEPEPRLPQYILTEPGIGYYFNRFEIKN